jgi:hypothetical protein
MLPAYTIENRALIIWTISRSRYGRPRICSAGPEPGLTTIGGESPFPETW